MSGSSAAAARTASRIARNARRIYEQAGQIIDALERELARPVISPNQALLWAAMGAIGAPTDAITGYGRLFATS
jgi:maleate cis-trans isomerase